MKEYLDSKGVVYKEKNGELITKCIFNNCDNNKPDTRLHFNLEKEIYHCFRCDTKGTFTTLKKHFGDYKASVIGTGSVKTFKPEYVEKYHQNLTTEIKDYLNNRGISDEVINKFKLGYWNFYGKNFITIPIVIDDQYAYLKLREDPSTGNSKITFPKGTATMFGEYSTDGTQVICEGELDALALISKGVPAITSTHGAKTFNEGMVSDKLTSQNKIYVCMDNDDAGREGAEKALSLLYHKFRLNNLYKIKLPAEVGEKGDITDYLTKLKYPPEDLFNKYSEIYPSPVDHSKFSEMKMEDIANILDLTIKRDEGNKVATFLAMLTTYTDSSQMNVLFSGSSSSGKTYLALEIGSFFPEEDKVILLTASKTSFIHEQGYFNDETKEKVVDLSKKIIIFLDMPDTLLLHSLRPMLSHDTKEIIAKVTDKSDKGGLRTKTVRMIGYPTVFFCTATGNLDLQELTRFIIISPEVNKEKVTAGIRMSIAKNSNLAEYKATYQNDELRNLLIERIQSIKQERIEDVILKDQEKIQELFTKSHPNIQPRHQRDVTRLICFVKSFALLNLWWRERQGKTIFANDDDIKQGFAIWEKISRGSDYNLPPYVYDTYVDVIKPLIENKEIDPYNGRYATRADIRKKYQEINGIPLGEAKLRNDILPPLENEGLITQEKSFDDGRNVLIKLTPNNSVND